MSALVVGCFVPDFSYLRYLSQRTSFGHTIAGMFVLDLPLALLALWLFHAFIKKPMFMYLPAGFRQRLKTSVITFSFWPAKRFLLIILSILVGTATHLLWDSFTHSNFWPYEHWAFLRSYVDLPIDGEMAMYKVLEIASSVFGLAVVTVWILHWYRNTKPFGPQIFEPEINSRRRTLIAILPSISILGGVLRAYRAGGIHLQIRRLAHFTIDTVISAVALFLIGLLVLGVIRQWRIDVGRQA